MYPGGVLASDYESNKAHRQKNNSSAAAASYTKVYPVDDKAHEDIEMANHTLDSIMGNSKYKHTSANANGNEPNSNFTSSCPPMDPNNIGDAPTVGGEHDGVAATHPPSHSHSHGHSDKTHKSLLCGCCCRKKTKKRPHNETDEEEEEDEGWCSMILDEFIC